MEKTYITGLFAKKPHEKAPEFVKAKISMKREEMIASLQAMTDEWVNVDVKEGKDGKYYTQIDTWKPKVGDKVEAHNDDDF